MRYPVTRSILLLCVLTLISTLVTVYSSTTMETSYPPKSNFTMVEWYVELVNDTDKEDNRHIITYPRRSIHITEVHARRNPGNIFIVEYAVSLPLYLTVHLGNASIVQTFTEDTLDFLGGTYSNCDESDGTIIAVFLNNTHLRLKVNSTEVGELSWNIKMYDFGRLYKEISGSMIFDRIIFLSVSILEPDDFDDKYAWGGQYNFTFKWNPETDRWEAVP